jgi:hypothetical protein
MTRAGLAGAGTWSARRKARRRRRVRSGSTPRRRSGSCWIASPPRRLPPPPPAPPAAAAESGSAADALREELRARDAEVAAAGRRAAEAEQAGAARVAAAAAECAAQVAALEAAHAARAASMEEAHAARVAALESERRMLLAGGDDKARLKEELLRLHQELYSTQALPHFHSHSPLRTPSLSHHPFVPLSQYPPPSSSSLFTLTFVISRSSRFRTLAAAPLRPLLLSRFLLCPLLVCQILTDPP